ncbi:ubiquitin-conjugating enzyme [Metarhizium robertsii ARSEF 23]|uniref:Ubiquitin-conjugating enzyme n=1 Tax=Metarhizium robertsii (strain ARSEF 23 / ATCC MYA-3075) TaxID=655844 RepID=A0A0B2XA74_METRA|nr:ubiquitin-conjugating enzyme [Metarhizium robertsii ARSEF 23]KHO11748.1 ubiquitin-conjugating enzyme [Metarhizium robertsii ARSEF 23]
MAGRAGSTQRTRELAHESATLLAGRLSTERPPAPANARSFPSCAAARNTTPPQREPGARRFRPHPRKTVAAFALRIWRIVPGGRCGKQAQRQDAVQKGAGESALQVGRRRSMPAWHAGSHQSARQGTFPRLPQRGGEELPQQAEPRLWNAARRARRLCG